MKISYPVPMKNKQQTDNHFKSAGMLFENALNISNEYYLQNNIAIIHKKPTPIQVVKVDYPKRSAAKIVEAYYKTPSTTDYNGLYKGKYIDYEAKETVKNYFPFKHIYEHQVEHLVNVDKQGGIAFVIIYYRESNLVYIFSIKVFNDLYVNSSKKSINIEDAEKYGVLVKLGYTPPIDYLEAVNRLFKIN